MTKKFVHEKLISYSDGGSRSNPGPAGIGAVLVDPEGLTIGEWSEFLGVATNNQAEYKALLLVLKQAQALGVEELECRLDSELVVKQMRGEYKVKHPDLKPLYEIAVGAAANFKKIAFKHIPRALNKRADELANEAMDRGK